MQYSGAVLWRKSVVSGFLLPLLHAPQQYHHNLTSALLETTRFVSTMPPPLTRRASTLHLQSTDAHPIVKNLDMILSYLRERRAMDGAKNVAREVTNWLKT